MKLGYVNFYVDDVVASAVFYEKAFGVSRRVVTPDGLFIQMDTGETLLGFAAASMAHANGLSFTENGLDKPAPAMEVTFFADDVDHAYHRAVAAGACPVKPPETTARGQTLAYVRDLNGYIVEVSTPPTQLHALGSE